MDLGTISRIESWDARPVSGGFAGLHDLADATFTGAVVSDEAYLFMLNGRVVGVVDGSLDEFEDAEGTAYTAPDPVLPLLFAMQEQGGEVRGKYYTDDTPLREVDETLSSGGFTGYLELSENVLSGDYYVVYYGGRSLSAAFVGRADRIITGEEAFERAADEVGIYEVRSVDLDVTDVPEPVAGATAGATSTDVDDRSVVDSSEGTSQRDDSDAIDEGSDGEDQPDDGAPTGPSSAADTAGIDDTGASAGPEPDRPTKVDESTDETPPEEATDPERPEAATPNRDATRETATSAIDAAAPGPVESGEAEATDPTERFEEEARWREASTVPALDPEESAEPPAPEEPSAASTGSEGDTHGAEASREPEPTESPSSAPEPAATSTDTTRTPDPDDRERIRQLEAELESSERERRRLTEQVDELVADREELEAERDALSDRIEELEDRIEAAEAAAEAAVGSSSAQSEDASTHTSLDHETALDQTDLFVRYGSKGKATLETAHDGQADQASVEENLRIESHSRFDPDTATVDGRPFYQYLHETIEFRFVRWLIEELLYEVQDTGTEAGLRRLYDALPAIDRAEFYGTVTSTDEEGNDVTQPFDVICRDRMGKPLIVANINDSLDPATRDMMGRLVEDATAAGEGQEALSAAFLVTASFFEPDALETAADATRGGGFLSRDSKLSFVRLSRTEGYHLCLVEARGDDFHVAVPEI